jgi:hypothetical protein
MSYLLDIGEETRPESPFFIGAAAGFWGRRDSETPMK